MKQSLLDILRCPFCGTRLELVDNDALVRSGDTIESGVLGCQCCAFPIVAGIPVLIADDPTRAAMHALEAGRAGDALSLLLGLEDDRARAFAALRHSRDRMTYKRAIEILSPDAEGTYFIYRFSDPTYVMAQTILEGIGQNRATVAGRVLDLCGGSGHLTRVLAALKPAGETILADVFYWKLWLAKEFTAPSCQPICCDANNPLPFERDTFSMVVLSDAFPYIWHKRMLADEMMRAAGPGGTVVMPHLHSSLGENFSAGMTLTPAAYRDLFAPMQPRLFSDRTLFDAAVTRGAVDLSGGVTAEALDGEPSLTLVASPHADIFRRYEPVAVPGVSGELKVNPLYRETVPGAAMTLTFPTPEYEEEFAECKRYLAASVTLPVPLTQQALGTDYESLRRRRIVLDAPLRYF
jgi:uncharacterized protein YbaR (Trm112 family)/SAM-dependent methyltransferase